MSAALVFCSMAVLAAAPASGQAPAPNPYGLDPYKPSEAAILRNYSSILLSQTPLPEFTRLDPYKPSHAAILQLAGALPLWGLGWYPFQPLGAVTLLDPRQDESPVANVVERSEPHPDGEERSMPSTIATLRRPEGNDGVWLTYGGHRWLAAGKAVAFEESGFERVGAYEGFPVFKRRGEPGDVIYIPSRGGLVSPYRPKADSR